MVHSTRASCTLTSTRLQVPVELSFLPKERPVNNTANLKVSPVDMLRTTPVTPVNSIRDTTDSP